MRAIALCASSAGVTSPSATRSRSATASSHPRSSAGTRGAYANLPQHLVQPETFSRGLMIRRSAATRRLRSRVNPNGAAGRIPWCDNPFRVAGVRRWPASWTRRWRRWRHLVPAQSTGSVPCVAADALVLRWARTAQIVGVVMGGRKPPAAMTSRSRYPPPAPIQSASAPTAHRRRRTGPVSRLPCRPPRSNFLACCSSCDLHRSPKPGQNRAPNPCARCAPLSPGHRRNGGQGSTDMVRLLRPLPQSRAFR